MPESSGIICSTVCNLRGMSRIFISYRRDDTAADMTDRLYERLVRRWGRRVFMDIDSLVGGDLFAKAIEENLQNRRRACHHRPSLVVADQ